MLYIVDVGMSYDMVMQYWIQHCWCPTQNMGCRRSYVTFIHLYSNPTFTYNYYTNISYKSACMNAIIHNSKRTWKHRAVTHFRSGSNGQHTWRYHTWWRFLTDKCHFWTVPQSLWHLTSHKMCPQKKRKKKTHPPNPTSDSIKKCQFLMKTDLHWLWQKSLSSSIFAKETPLPRHGEKMSALFIFFFVERHFLRTESL